MWHMEPHLLSGLFRVAGTGGDNRERWPPGAILTTREKRAKKIKRGPAVVQILANSFKYWESQEAGEESKEFRQQFGPALT